MSRPHNYHFAQAIECDLKAQDAPDESVRRYFAKLARDYRRLAEVPEEVRARPNWQERPKTESLSGTQWS